jgi:hypothetical protein
VIVLALYFELAQGLQNVVRVLLDHFDLAEEIVNVVLDNELDLGRAKRARVFSLFIGEFADIFEDVDWSHYEYRSSGESKEIYCIVRVPMPSCQHRPRGSRQQAGGWDTARPMLLCQGPTPTAHESCLREINDSSL